LLSAEGKNICSQATSLLFVSLILASVSRVKAISFTMAGMTCCKNMNRIVQRPVPTKARGVEANLQLPECVVKMLITQNSHIFRMTGIC
jgi:hypothetical protein